MRKTISMLLTALLASAFSLPAAAHGGGGGGGFGGGFSHGSAVGPSSHSNESLENSNGRFALDRDQGRDRAEDRMSAEGTKHEKAMAKHKKQHHAAAASEATKEPIPTKQPATSTQ